MNTKLREIVNLDMVGKMQTTKSLKDLQKLVEIEKSNEEDEIRRKDKSKALLIIDPQNDFIAEEGSLPVKGAIDDTKRLINHIYKNIDEYEEIFVTLDSHNRNSIFFQSAWLDIMFQEVKEFTVIDEVGKFIPTPPFAQLKEEYLMELHEKGKVLTIWPYHCIIGTPGHCVENQLSQMLQFFELYKNKEVSKIMKGLGRYSEHYGALKPEVDVNRIDKDFKIEIPGTIKLMLTALKEFDEIDICGQAKDYCVYETIKQMCDYYNDVEINSKIHLIENMSSSIGDSKEVEKKYLDLIKERGISLVKYDVDLS